MLWEHEVVGSIPTTPTTFPMRRVPASRRAVASERDAARARMSERSMRDLNLAFRFLLELVVLAALAIWGLSASTDLLVQLVLGLGAPAVAIAIWSTFVSPKAPRRLDDPARLALEVGVFGAGVLALLLAGHPVPAVLLGVAAALSLGLMLFWGQRGQ